jgi:hypothetical protein
MITFTVTLVLSIFVLAGLYACYVFSQADLIVIKSPGREFTIDCSRWFKRGDPSEQKSEG